MEVKIIFQWPFFFTPVLSFTLIFNLDDRDQRDTRFKNYIIALSTPTKAWENLCSTNPPHFYRLRNPPNAGA